MRITGGSARGQILNTLPGLLVRPTTDKVREAIFSMLASTAKGWDTCLDLFAGTGALGIEALSREGRWVDFVDQNNKSCGIIRQNLQKTGFIDKARIHCCPVMKALTLLKTTYGVIFIDPPYADPSIGPVLTAIDTSSLVDGDSMIVVSHSSRNTLEDQYGCLSAVKQKRYGDTAISIYQKEAAS
jgi:16S rRNA (guanine966-N2)-methyltransferase